MAKIAFTSGTTGVKKRNFIVYMRVREAYTAAQALLGTNIVEGENVEDTIDKPIVLADWNAWIDQAPSGGEADQFFTKLGDTVADSVGHNLAGNEVVDLSEAGEVDIDKQGTITFNIANLSADNLNALGDLDGQTVDVLVESISGDFAFLFPEVIYKHNEAIQSGAVQGLPIEINKKVTAVNSFRRVFDIPTS